MAIPTLTRWFRLIKKSPRLAAQATPTIFLISGCRLKELAPPLLRKYFPDIDTTRTLQDFSWSDILFRSFRLAGRPSKENLSAPERLKRTVIRYFHHDYERTANIWNLVDLVFMPSPENSMFISGAHIVDMFAVHFPSFTVQELSGHTNAFRNRLIWLLARLSRRYCYDPLPGTTVFANLADPFLLKAYRYLHPNKTVYLRFHDRIDQVVKKSPPEKIRQTLDRLKRSTIIQEAETYYEPDAKALAITYRPNAVNQAVMDQANSTARYYLYTFIGTYKNRQDHSRLDDLQPIRQHLYALYPSARRYIQEKILVDLHNERIPYREYLKLIGQSEIVVDMYRVSADEGLSFRIPEALLLERKIITNRLIVLQADFYDPSRFFVIGHDSIDRLESFLTGCFKPLPEDIRHRFDCRDWWQATSSGTSIAR